MVIARPWSAGPIRVATVAMEPSPPFIKGNGPASLEGRRRADRFIDDSPGSVRSVGLAGRGDGLVLGVSAVAGALLGEGFQGLGPDADLGLLVALEPGPGGDEVAEDDVLLQADEVVDLAGQGRLGQDLGRLLEAGGRDEALGTGRRPW